MKDAAAPWNSAEAALQNLAGGLMIEGQLERSEGVIRVLKLLREIREDMANVPFSFGKNGRTTSFFVRGTTLYREVRRADGLTPDVHAVGQKKFESIAQRIATAVESSPRLKIMDLGFGEPEPDGLGLAAPQIAAALQFLAVGPSGTSRSDSEGLLAYARKRYEVAERYRANFVATAMAMWARCPRR